MPRISQPYYNLHQISTGHFTSGGEFVLYSGEEYIGPYHILPNGQRFTEFRPTQKSVELYELRLNPTFDILKYNQITGNKVNQYVVPISFEPLPNLDDYNRGWIERFFLQKRNNAEFTIIEIDSNQFNSINTKNNPGINGIIYNSLRIEWKISKLPKDDIFYLNSRTIQLNEPNFNGLTRYLINPLEFYR